LGILERFFRRAAHPVLFPIDDSLEKLKMVAG